MDFAIYPLAFLLALGILVTIHELGHFIVARASGVHVVRFSIGFGRPLWRRVDRFGTEFAIAVFPLGGYVRMWDDRDEDVVPAAGAKPMMSLSPWWRIAIALGGPVANFVLAVVVFFALALAGTEHPAAVSAAPAADSPLAATGLAEPYAVVSIDGEAVQGWRQVGMALVKRLGETGDVAIGLRLLRSDAPFDVRVPITDWLADQAEPNVLGAIGLIGGYPALLDTPLEDGPAARAGLRYGDLVTAVNSEPVATFSEFALAVQAHPETPVTLTLMRAGVMEQTTLVPERVQATDGSEVGRIGVRWLHEEISFTGAAAVWQGFAETWDKTQMTLQILGKMVTGHVSVRSISGPLGIAEVAGDSARYGWREFLGVLAFLSISLGVLNLLPIPVLDGGHIVYSSVELITGRPVSERIQVLGVQVGIMLVGGLAIMATYNDVLRWLS